MSATLALIPEDETVRLQTLRQYDVLHSLCEAVFGEFVALTARIFNLPISLIALVDEEQVFYPANHGLPGNAVLPRQSALCSMAILHNKAVVYKDLLTEQDPFVQAHAAPAAVRNGLRFYAAAPLRMPDQCSIGTLCIIDHNPRVFSAEEQRMLEELATLVSRTIVVRYQCQHRPGRGEQQWQRVCKQLQEEVQGLKALVRYMLTRNGTHVPVSGDVLGQVERRLSDLYEILAAA